MKCMLQALLVEACDTVTNKPWIDKVEQGAPDLQSKYYCSLTHACGNALLLSQNWNN